MNKKAQGEIFGIALFFVVLFIGFILYSQIAPSTTEQKVDAITQARYEILASSSVDVIMESSTGCATGGKQQSLADLIVYCGRKGFARQDPVIRCGLREERACSYAVYILNSSLNTLYNDSNIGVIPYELTIEVSQSRTFLLHNVTLNNFQLFARNNQTVTQRDIIRSFGNRARADQYILPHPQGRFVIEFNLYY